MVSKFSWLAIHIVSYMWLNSYIYSYLSIMVVLFIVHFTNHKAPTTMDDGKEFSNYQFSALNHQAVHSAESNNFLGTVH